MAGTAVLRKSNGTIFQTGLNPITNKTSVHNGHAKVTAGHLPTDYSDCTLVDATKDTQYQNATSGTPVMMGLDDIRCVPTYYPEVGV